jgi:hypothetical protein
MKTYKILLILSFAFISLHSFAQKNEKKNDSCDFNNFTIEDGSIIVNNEKSAIGIYISLNLSEKKGLASKVIMLLEIENCKGEKQYVKVELNYDLKTGSWVGKQVIPQNQDCNWKINSYKYLIYNNCNDEYESDDYGLETLKSGGTLPARNKIIARRRRSN